MRKLSIQRRTLAFRALCDGSSVNATARIAGVSKLTVLRLLADVGRLCRDYHDLTVSGLTCQRVQVDEIWSFVGAKQRNVDGGKQGHGNAWTWVAIDAETKLVVSYLVGERNAACARFFSFSRAWVMPRHGVCRLAVGDCPN